MFDDKTHLIADRVAFLVKTATVYFSTFHITQMICLLYFQINSLLKSDMFLEVIFNLLKSTHDMQKRALDLFVVKLEVQPAVFADESRISTLTSISNWLIKFVNESTNCAKSAETTALNLQSALNVLLHVSHVFSLDSTARVIPVSFFSFLLFSRLSP